MTRALGIIHIALSSILLLLGGGICAWLLVAEDPADLDAAGWVVMFFGIFAIVYLIPMLVGGMGLVLGKRWARGLIMILSVIMLLAFPLGTLLGGFSLWVLFTDTPEPPVPLGFQEAGSRSNIPSSSA